MLHIVRFSVLWFLVASVVISCLATVSSAGVLSKGDIVKLSWGNGTAGHSQGGGEFALFKLVGLDTRQQDIWQLLSVPVFCVEYNEHVWLDTKMLVGSVSDRAVFGGQSGQLIDGAGNNWGDPIDTRTKFLYDNYATHALANQGFVYGNNAWADSLQEAIWKIEGEKLNSRGHFAGFSTRYGQDLYNYAHAHGGPTSNSVFVVNLFAINTPAQALELFDPLILSTWSAVANYRRQDQLYYEPVLTTLITVPEPYSWQTWLFVAAATLASAKLCPFKSGRLLPTKTNARVSNQNLRG